MQTEDHTLLRQRREPLLGLSGDTEEGEAGSDDCSLPGPWQEQITLRAAFLGAVLVFITTTISLRGTLSNSGTSPMLVHDILIRAIHVCFHLT